MRRPVLDVAWSRSAIWTRRFALLGAGLSLLAIATSHHGILGPRHALAVLAAGIASSLLALACSGAAMADIWRDGSQGAGRIVVGLALAAATLAYPAVLAVRAARETPAMEVSTDTSDPPRLSRSTRAFAARGIADPLPPAPWSSVGRTDERPPVLVDAPAAEAFDDVMKTLKALRWRVVDAAAPGGRTGLGHVDAVTYSAVMHLPEDVAIRIKPLAGQTRIDVRATSRLGLPDFGDEARSVDALGDALRAQDDDK